MPRCATVTVADILELRADGLTEPEVWALLSQSIEALQALFLSGDLAPTTALPVLPPSAILFSCRGRVVFEKSTVWDRKYETVVAPEYQRTHPDEWNTLWEKMWVFSLGKSLQLSMKNEHDVSNALVGVLEMMTQKEADERSSLMDVLNVIADNCKRNFDGKPFSHQIVDLYREVLGTPPQCLSSPETDAKEPECLFKPEPMEELEERNDAKPFQTEPKFLSETPTTTSSKTAYSTTSSVGSPATYRRRNPVQRAASRLYRGPSSHSQFPEMWKKYQGPNTCVGPEFIVRAHEPPRVAHVGNAKTQQRRTVTVLLLNGQRIQLTVDPRTTIGQVFQVAVEIEQLDDNYLFGICALLDGDFVFLPDDFKLYKAAPSDWREAPSLPWLLYLRFRYFLPSSRGLRRWETKHLLYLQLRRSILDRQVSCSHDDFVMLGGLALQAEFGDYSEEQHGSGDYFLPEHYLPEDRVSEELMSRLRNEHASRCGLDPGRAEQMFIGEVQRYPEYGHHHHSAVWCRGRSSSNVPLTVSVSPEGVCLFAWDNGQRKVHERFAWKAIQRLSFDKHFFTILPHDVGGLEATRYKLKMENKKSLHVFRLASFHHQVFLKLRLELCSLNVLSLQFGVPLQNENTTFVLENRTNALLERCERKDELPRRRRGVKMGVRAFRKPSLSEASNSSSDAYVIETGSGAFSMDLHESLPSTLADKLRDLSCQGERLIIKITLIKDKYGSVGLEVTEGGDGGLFIQNILRSGGDLARAAVGDQVLAVDGACVLGRGYGAALAALRTAGDRVDVLLARTVTPADPKHDYLRNIRYDTAFECETFSLTNVPISRPIVRF